jgi:hypothetical protein
LSNLQFDQLGLHQTLGITTFSIMTLSMAIINVKLSINDTQHNTESIVPTVVMPKGNMLNTS